MKMNFVVPIMSAILLGYLCASFIFREYGINSYVFSNDNVYYLQCGAYNTYEASKTDLKDLTEKITLKENNRYYSYVGITTDIDVAKKIEKLYEDKGVGIYIKKATIDNEDFLNELSQYDVLLKESKNLNEIKPILKTILATFEEIVLNP